MEEKNKSVTNDIKLITIVRSKDDLQKKKLFCCPEDWSCDLVKQAEADGRKPRAGQSLPEWHDDLWLLEQAHR